jgi:hypothetical protein
MHPSFKETLESASHPFLKTLMENNKDYLKHVVSSLGKKIKGMPTEPIQLDSHHFYTSQVMDAVVPILNTLDRIRWARAFLTTFPNAKEYKKKGVTRDRWIEYHYTYYAVSYATIRDLALLLTNEVFRLKLPPRLCSMEAIVGNGWVKPTELPAILNELATQAKSHQEAKNLHVHRGKTPDIAALLDDDHFRTLGIISLGDLIGPQRLGAAERAIIQAAYRMTVGKLAERVDAEIAKLDSILVKLFTFLEAYYRREYDELAPIDFDQLTAAAGAHLKSKAHDHRDPSASAEVS